MIQINLSIRHPRWIERFYNIKVWHGSTPWKTKFWEVQVIKNEHILRIEFDFTTRQDHAGANLELGLFGYEIHCKFYDNRHWDYKNNQWQKYDTD